jgi:hypothetical protein
MRTGVSFPWLKRSLFIVSENKHTEFTLQLEDSTVPAFLLASEAMHEAEL